MQLNQLPNVYFLFQASTDETGQCKTFVTLLNISLFIYKCTINYSQNRYNV